METVLRILNSVQNYQCLRIEERKFISLRVINMLIEKYSCGEDDVDLAVEMMPDLIDSIMDVASDAHLLPSNRIEKVKKVKKGCFMWCR